MAALVTNLTRDGETRPFKAHGKAVLGSAGALTLMQATFEPGWKWSTDIKPIAGTTSCQTRHLGYVLSGRMQVRCDDGTEIDLGPGDLFDLPAGHDAWVVGDEPCVMIDCSVEATRYARTGATTPIDDKYMTLVRGGYDAFNARDVPGLTRLLARDVVQHVPGHGPTAGTYKGLDAVLGYYGKLGELTDNTFRADLIDVHGDAQGHVIATHQITATRNGTTRVSKGSILFTFVGEKVTDLLQLHGDLAGDDAFLA